MMTGRNTLAWTDRKRRAWLEVDKLKQEQLRWESERDGIRGAIVTAMATKRGAEQRFSVASLKERYAHVDHEWHRVSARLGVARQEFDGLR
jgi:hypothetical protein